MKEEEIVFVIDDDPAVRDSLTLLLEAEHFTVQAFADAASFLAAARPLCRSCAIIDLHMPDMDGLCLQEELALRAISLPVIFLTGNGDIPQSVRAIKGGATDFLTKPVKADVLLEQVRTALLASKRLSEQAQEIQNARACVERLTEREQQVMVLAAEGLANKEIARRLAISYRTVEIYKTQISSKTGVKKLPSLISIVKASGLDRKFNPPVSTNE